MPDHLVDIEFQLSAGNQDLSADDARNESHGELTFDALATLYTGNVRAELRLQHGELLFRGITQAVKTVDLGS